MQQKTTQPIKIIINQTFITSIKHKNSAKHDYLDAFNLNQKQSKSNTYHNKQLDNSH